MGHAQGRCNEGTVEKGILNERSTFQYLLDLIYGVLTPIFGKLSELQKD